MNYKRTIEYLYNSTPVFEKVGASAYKEGLFNSIELDKHLGNPHKNYITIHIAGTNGKGSVSHSIAAILQNCGCKVGLYTSPHLVDFRERIRINGEMISEKYVVDFVEQHKPFFEPLHPSFFELTTALAFKYFSDSKVDIAVIETGLGGRLDCTNIITPTLSIITNIGFDHMQFLGNTLDKIAGEKAGIIKDGVPVVIGEHNDITKPVFENKAKEMKANIVFAQESNQIIQAKTLPCNSIEYKTKDFGTFQSDLLGTYQKANTNTILHSLQILEKQNIIKNRETAIKALGKVSALTGLKGRWQIINKKPLTVCDTGHNLEAWLYLSKQIAQQKAENTRIIFGMCDDKDIQHVMKTLPKQAIYYFTKAETKRAIHENEIKHMADNLNLRGKTYPNVKQAVQQARAEAHENDFIFIGGSCYIVADYLTYCV